LYDQHRYKSKVNNEDVGIRTFEAIDFDAWISERSSFFRKLLILLIYSGFMGMAGLLHPEAFRTPDDG